MDRRELIRHYRRMAKQSHPDTGGDKEAFVHIKAAFECLLRRKP
jgi:DnaJ-class molecular chaperone